MNDGALRFWGCKGLVGFAVHYVLIGTSCPK